MNEREEPKVAAERLIARDPGEHRRDVVGDAAFGMAEPRRSPIEPGAQPRVVQKLSLELVLGGHDVDHADRMGLRGRRDHWDIPMR